VAREVALDAAHALVSNDERLLGVVEEVAQS
jgi:hypothetical protein